jgi:ubiquinone/menaquinone biosynthesis C-methylase UbiE
MSRSQVDYDRLAPTYDRRFETGEQQGVLSALKDLLAEVRADRILEAGCGTGHWLAALAPAARQSHGLDFSAGMLNQARQRDQPLDLVRARAGSPPYAGEAFDLVLCVNAIHHFRDAAGFVQEACRLLRPGGVLGIIGTNPDCRRDRWYVYDCFEGTWETDLGRFPSWGSVLDWALRAGFERVAWHAVERIHDPKHGRAVLDDPFLRKEACSQLALLSDEGYAAGIRRIREILEQAEIRGDTPIFQSDLTVGMLIAYKGGPSDQQTPSHTGPERIVSSVTP